ncbi:prenyltransferase [bacterium]|nr:prenyltransferase [bacterium]
MPAKLKIWVKALRAPFTAATVISAVLGGIIAWYMTGNLHWGHYLLSCVGIFFANLGVNLGNDYFDHTSKLDDINKTPTPFSGGSRVIQEKLLKPRSILIGALLSFFIALLIGVYLNFQVKGNVVLIIGVAGLFMGYFYTAPPFRFGYTPIGEFVTGLNVGPLIIYGSYYVQAQNLSWIPLLMSIPGFISGALILYINEFQDYEADKAIGKKNMIVLLGKKRAARYLPFILAFIFLWIIVGTILGLYPYFSLITLLTLPLAIKAAMVARKNYDKIEELLPANASVIGLHVGFSILLAVGFILGKLI